MLDSREDGDQDPTPPEELLEQPTGGNVDSDIASSDSQDMSNEIPF
jgi:hypothetical protein